MASHSKNLGTLFSAQAAFLAMGLATGEAKAQGFVGSTTEVPFVVAVVPLVGNGAVGGVSIDAAGLVARSKADQCAALRDARERSLAPLAGNLDRTSESRKISLRRLQIALAQLREDGKPLPDEVLFLAGLQRVRHLFVYPEQHDIVLAGYAEGWQVDDEGNVVGTTSGRPVLLFDDLLVALRSAFDYSQGGIACSIDPTPEGLRRLQEFIANAPLKVPNAERLAELVRELGPQTVTIRGVPETSHFARALVAADYRMKRFGMGFEKSPVKGLPSYLQLVKPSVRSKENLLPRWWLEADYEPLLTDGEGLAWELSTAGVRAMSQDALAAADAQPARGKKAAATSAAAKWAASLTEHYEALALRLPVFAELKNLIDLAIVAALISKERLADRAECELSLLMDPEVLAVSEFAAPRQVASRASVLNKSGHWVLSVSGGVALNAWGALERSEISESLTSLREEHAGREESRWWWD
jgi:hypothetical protein